MTHSSLLSRAKIFHKANNTYNSCKSNSLPFKCHKQFITSLFSLLSKLYFAWLWRTPSISQPDSIFLYGYKCGRVKKKLHVRTNILETFCWLHLVKNNKKSTWTEFWKVAYDLKQTKKFPFLVCLFLCLWSTSILFTKNSIFRFSVAHVNKYFICYPNSLGFSFEIP